MDWLTFIAEVTKAVAWPLAVLIIFAVLRAPLLRLLPLVTRVKVNDFEFDFERRLEEAAADAAALPAPTPSAQSLPTATGDKRLLELADTSPRAAILEAWIALERAAVDAARRHNITIAGSQLRSPRELIQFLEEARVVSMRQAAIFHDLRGLRNSAAHASRFTPTAVEAKEYVRIAARLEQSLAEA